VHVAGASFSLAAMLDEADQPDSSFHFATEAFRLATTMHGKLFLSQSSSLLSKHWKKKRQLDSALYYEHIANVMGDSLFGKEKSKEMLSLVLQEQKRGQEIQQAEERQQNKIIVIGLSTLAAILIFAGVVLYQSNMAKHKSNLALEKSLFDLKSAQAQLIQSEKMASLGELTAGIAHEIQNPLNFVNNFSEVNAELINELREEAEKGNLAEVRTLVKGLKDNEEKINQHGRRADAIVKSMLQHSRKSTGRKELININALCDEYLRLAYHGLRAKDKSFNAKFETDFDSSIPKVNVIPQDIGRVVLNLINNAFYAVSEKKKLNIDGYEPTVFVTTKNLSDKIEIRVKDNGTGIPEKVKEKIFQPFFTTKPTGQGTGLGLSLAYDIVTKGHSGELKLQTQDGDGSTFIIQVPSV
jgi:signal transduction histidine kinase